VGPCNCNRTHACSCGLPLADACQVAIISSQLACLGGRWGRRGRRRRRRHTPLCIRLHAVQPACARKKPQPDHAMHASVLISCRRLQHRQHLPTGTAQNAALLTLQQRPSTAGCTARRPGLYKLAIGRQHGVCCCNVVQAAADGAATRPRNAATRSATRQAPQLAMQHVTKLSSCDPCTRAGLAPVTPTPLSPLLALAAFRPIVGA
jgi:hypothetical protein